MQNSFTAQIFNEVGPLLARIFAHPFNAELARGTLSRERFCGYMQQDSLYLVHFSRALAVAAGRSDRPERSELLISSSHNALLVERALHEHYFAEYGVRDEVRVNPACLGYTSFVLATAALGSFGEALAALLPCFWIYREVGRHIAAEAVSPNPYAKWIEAYSDAEFSRRVDRFAGVVDAVASEAGSGERWRMRERFMTASQYEYYFWDDAYMMRNFDGI